MTLFRRKAPSLPAAGGPDPAPPAGPSTPHSGVPPGVTVDICSALFNVCKQCQETHLDTLGASCMFDVDGGQVPSWMFDMLRAVVQLVMTDIAAGVHRSIPGGAVGITLRRSGNFWALAIAENLSGSADERRAARRLTMIRALTDRMDCVCRILPNAWGSTVAIAFPISDAATGGAGPIPVNRVIH